MDKSESVVELTKALNSFQGKLKAVKKDAVNPFFKSRYATLDTIWETIREPLSSNGLVLTQTLDQAEGKALLVTTLFHISGEWIEGSMPLNPVKDDPQGLGSAISYARRYSLCAMLGVVADEDDDANVATKSKKPTEVKQPLAPTTKPTGNEPEDSSSSEKEDKVLTIQAFYNWLASHGKTFTRSWFLKTFSYTEEDMKDPKKIKSAYVEVKEIQAWQD